MSSRPTPEQILSSKSTGSNGLVAYAVVNSLRLGVPVLDPNIDSPPYLAFALVVTNRVGLVVAGPPGGTQDLLATKKGTQPFSLELDKPDKSGPALERLGLKLSTDRYSNPNEQLVATLLEAGYNVRLETPFAAALRETVEEHGLDINSTRYVGSPQQFRVSIVSKRSITAAERGRRDLFDLDGVRTLTDLNSIASGLNNSVQPAEQVLFAVQVPSFENVRLVNNEHVEHSRIPGREGQPYYERGAFLTVADQRQLVIDAIAAEPGLRANGNNIARLDVVAAFGRLQIMAGIEAYLVQEAQAKGQSVSALGEAPPLTPVQGSPNNEVSKSIAVDIQR